jgi:hypothetical protein
MATTNIDTALPDVDLAPGTTVTVDAGAAGATISLLNVYTASPVAAAQTVDELLAEPFVPLFTYGTPAGSSA